MAEFRHTASMTDSLGRVNTLSFIYDDVTLAWVGLDGVLQTAMVLRVLDETGRVTSTRHLDPGPVRLTLLLAERVTYTLRDSVVDGVVRLTKTVSWPHQLVGA